MTAATLKLPEAITLVFVAVKLNGGIDWPWAVVMLPTILGFLILVGFNIAERTAEETTP